jgi:hypothetical protein
MSSPRWQKIENLFHAALERKPGERTAFLIEACREDPGLRAEVQALLASSDAQDGFLERPAMELEAESLSRERPAALTGRRIAHYVIGPLIGAGGMGEVYKAHDTVLDRNVAVKFLIGASHLDSEGLHRFHREARLLASVEHPNVASVYGFEQVDGMCALVMELVEGETLSDRIARKGLSEAESLSIAGQIAAAVEAAHAREIIHRDLKPSNVCLSKDGTVKVLDFGLARILQPASDSGIRRPHALSTQSLSIAGTIQYMSPEQTRNDSVDRTTDIWAWGCVLYEMLTGQRSFDGISWAHTLAKIASEDPDWTRLPASTPVAVRSLLEDCLQKDRSRRLRDIAEARRRIENAHITPVKHPTSAAEDDIALSVKAARAWFLLIQCGLLAMYVAALFYVERLGDLLVPIVIITAMSGIAVRIFLMSSVALQHPAAGRKFRRLFPVLLLLDAMWAASPLLVNPLNVGLKLAGAAGLAYLPFAQRTLMERLYGKK